MFFFANLCFNCFCTWLCKTPNWTSFFLFYCTFPLKVTFPLKRTFVLVKTRFILQFRLRKTNADHAIINNMIQLLQITIELLLLHKNLYWNNFNVVRIIGYCKILKCLCIYHIIQIIQSINSHNRWLGSRSNCK